jgi:hypothetical protein
VRTSKCTARPRNGTVVARRVEIEEHVIRHAEGFELHGAITAIDHRRGEDVVLSAASRSPTAPGAVDFRKGTAAELAVGVQCRGARRAVGRRYDAARHSASLR